MKYLRTLLSSPKVAWILSFVLKALWEQKGIKAVTWYALQRVSAEISSIVNKVGKASTSFICVEGSCSVRVQGQRAAGTSRWCSGPAFSGLVLSKYFQELTAWLRPPPVFGEKGTHNRRAVQCRTADKLLLMTLATAANNRFHPKLACRLY